MVGGTGGEGTRKSDGGLKPAATGGAGEAQEKRRQAGALGERFDGGAKVAELVFCDKDARRSSRKIGQDTKDRASYKRWAGQKDRAGYERWGKLKVIGQQDTGGVCSKRSSGLCQVIIEVVSAEFPVSQHHSVPQGQLPSRAVGLSRNGLSTDSRQIFAAEALPHPKPHTTHSQVALVAAGAEISVMKILIEGEMVESVASQKSERGVPHQAQKFTALSMHAIAV